MSLGFLRNHDGLSDNCNVAVISFQIGAVTDRQCIQRLRLVLVNESCCQVHDLSSFGTFDRCKRLAKLACRCITNERYVIKDSLNLMRYATGSQCSCLSREVMMGSITRARHRARKRTYYGSSSRGPTVITNTIIMGGGTIHIAISQCRILL